MSLSAIFFANLAMPANLIDYVAPYSGFRRCEALLTHAAQIPCHAGLVREVICLVGITLNDTGNKVVSAFAVLQISNSERIHEYAFLFDDSPKVDQRSTESVRHASAKLHKA